MRPGQSKPIAPSSTCHSSSKAVELAETKRARKSGRVFCLIWRRSRVGKSEACPPWGPDMEWWARRKSAFARPTVFASIPLDQRAAALVERAERLVAGHGRDQLVEVP